MKHGKTNGKHNWQIAVAGPDKWAQSRNKRQQQRPTIRQMVAPTAQQSFSDESHQQTRKLNRKKDNKRIYRIGRIKASHCGSKLSIGIKEFELFLRLGSASFPLVEE